MLTWPYCLITGRLQHWVKENNSYVAILEEFAKTYPPAIEKLFLNFTASSYIVVNLLVGPESGRKRIIKKDVLEITGEQFEAIHTLIIWAFVALFVYQNPRLKDSHLEACETFLGFSEEAIVKYVLQMDEINGSSMYSLGSHLFSEIAKILDYQDVSFSGQYLFATIFMAAYSSAMEDYREAML